MNLGIDLITKMLKKIYHIFFLSKVEKKLYNYFNKKNDDISMDKATDIVLIQCVEDYFYFGLFGEITLALKSKRSVHVEQYVVRSLTLGASKNMRSALISVFFANRFRDNKWIKLYSSYCDNVAYRHEGSTTLLSDIRFFNKAYKIYKSLKSKDELLKLEIDNIKVGDLIYDSYLRYKPAPTLKIDDFYLCIIIWQAFRNIYMTKKYFNAKKPSILLNSYSTYIQHGISARVALLYGTKVFTFGNYQTFSKELKIDYPYHTSNYKNYMSLFNEFEEKEKKLDVAKLALENKLLGKLDTSLAYMKSSAYIESSEKLPNVEGSIIVFLHDFYDSPHVYGNMVFPDFLEWIEFTIKVLKKNKIPFYLKEHPNQIEESKDVIKGLKKKYPFLQFVSSKITNKQLVEAGIKAGVSVYGTVAHELAYMGVPVIMCAENPHSSYNFCFVGNSKEDYSDLLINYEKLVFSSNTKKDIESFYYMHNCNKTNDESNLIHSFVELFTYTSKQAYEIDLDTYNELRNKIINNVAFTNFINTLEKVLI